MKNPKENLVLRGLLLLIDSQGSLVSSNWSQMLDGPSTSGRALFLLFIWLSVYEYTP